MLKHTVLAVWVVVLCVGAGAQTRRPPRPNIDVPRADSATPEINGTAPAHIPNGKATEVVVSGQHFPTTDVELSVSGHCKLLKGVMAGRNEAHFTVISTDDEGGNCALTIDGKPRNIYSDVEIEPTPAVRKANEAREAEEQKKNMAEVQKAEALLQKAPEMVGKKWLVTLPNGKSDTWTFVNEAFSGGEFKSAAGQKITIMMQPDDQVMIIAEEGCVFSGTLAGGKVIDGKAEVPASLCKLGEGKWSATVSH